MSDTPRAFIRHVGVDLGRDDTARAVVNLMGEYVRHSRFHGYLLLDLEKLAEQVLVNLEKHKGERRWLGGAIRLQIYEEPVLQPVKEESPLSDESESPLASEAK